MTGSTGTGRLWVQAQGVAAPYGHAMDHLNDELRRLDMLLEFGIQAMNPSSFSSASSPSSSNGLYMTESEAKQWLLGDSRFLERTAAQTSALHKLEARIATRLAMTGRLKLDLPLVKLQRLFRLSDREIRFLIAAMAPHVNRKYGKLYAYLQDDLTCPYPTVELIIKLCCNNERERDHALEQFSESSPFYRNFFHAKTREEDFRAALSHPIELDHRMVRYIMGATEFNCGEAASPGCDLYDDLGKSLPEIWTHLEMQERLNRYLSQSVEARQNPVILIQGRAGSGKTFHARHACKALDRPLLEWDLSGAPLDGGAFRKTLDYVLREARLHNAVPAFGRMELFEQQDQTAASGGLRRMPVLFDRVKAWEGPVFLFCESDWKLPMSPRMEGLSLHLPEPDIGERRALWFAVAKEAFALSEEEAGVLTGKFRFTPGMMKAAVDAARVMAAWERTADPSEPVREARLLHQAAYRLVQHRLQHKAVKLEPKYNWEDLILPNETVRLLRQACNRLRLGHIVMDQWGFESKLAYGKGISMLFTGPPGTGKTMSAMVMAKAMDAELYRIDLSRVVSKYIGETEKNLSEIFDQARQSGAILFFDEADALFGKRSEVKDAHDKYANMETSYLLQKMEEYDGLTILATNFAQNLDEAFTRRIQFIIKFPFPDMLQREQLWRSAFPRPMPVSDDIDFAYLAKTFELAGGPIKNSVMTAAFLAAEEGSVVTMKQLIEAVGQEYKKSNKVLLKDRLGAYAGNWKG